MLKRSSSLVLAVMLMSCGGGQAPDDSTVGPKFEATWESIRNHEVPEWFDDAKLGIFVHWGLYSVPAWAPPMDELGEADWDVWFTNNAYAELYQNSLRITGSLTQEHHYRTYGKDFDYFDFVPRFNEEAAKWDPDGMASLFESLGARYVVLTAKHHDGFTLWPSGVENPNLSPEVAQASRDVVGELTEAVRDNGMRMGLYYSGGLDWSFNPQPIVSRDDLAETVPHNEEYAAYADAHWRELIDKYEPAVLWNDIAYPRQGDIAAIMADYYNRFPDGLVNNRFETLDGSDVARHHDFVTLEYSNMAEIPAYKWEACRGIGNSFGYNSGEGPEQTIGEAELIHLLIDIVSKNGNLLLNVGPMADGTIPQIQLDRLEALGGWLDVNGEAIFGTRPWERPTATTGDGGDVRFTRKGDVLYVILLSKPAGAEVTIEGLALEDGRAAQLLGGDGGVSYDSGADATTFHLPELPEAHAFVLKVG